MDFFTPKEVLVIVGIIAVIAIILDGARRVKRNRYEKLQMSSRKLQQESVEYDEDEDELDQSQFPSGGSRIIGSRDVEEPRLDGNFDFGGKPEQQGFDLDHSIYASRDDDLSQSRNTVSNDPSDITPVNSQDVLVMHLVAKKGDTVSGESLLETAVDAGLRYGEMKIFHRHLNDDGSGQVLFSMANLVNPGTFDLNTMKTITTPGVTLFMPLDDIEDPVSALEVMIQTVDTLVEKLPLNVMDESRSSMTRQTIDHYRQRAKKASLQQSNQH
jgi:cell division protein ZipA